MIEPRPTAIGANRLITDQSSSSDDKVKTDEEAFYR
jgi:hypothetical protein